jgi:hypothetical protein
MASLKIIRLQDAKNADLVCIGEIVEKKRLVPFSSPKQCSEVREFVRDRIIARALGKGGGLLALLPLVQIKAEASGGLVWQRGIVYRERQDL